MAKKTKLNQAELASADDNLYKPTEKEEEIRKHIYKRFEEMRTAEVRVRAEKEWKKGEEQWEAIRKEDSAEWKSNYYVPLTTSVVESAISEMVDNNTYPYILPRTKEDIPKAKVMKYAFEYSFEIGDFADIKQDIIRAQVIRGTAFGHEFYYKDRRLVQDILDMGKANKMKKSSFETEEREVFEFDDVYNEYVSNWEIYPDEKAMEFNTGTKKARDVIRRYVMHYDDAKRFFETEQWNHLNNFQYVRPGRPANSYQYYKHQNDVGKEDVEVLWYWSRSPVDMLSIVINDVPIRIGPNIYRHKLLPYAKCVDIKRLDGFYGKGEPALLESIQHEVNTMRRMIIDRNHLDIDKSFVIADRSMLDSDDLIAAPHNMIAVNDVNDIKPIEYNDIPLSVDRTLKSIGDDKISVTGIDERFQSVQRTPSTATEAAILKESTLKRIKMKVHNLENKYMVEIARMRVENIIQFYSQGKLEKIVGPDNRDKYLADMARYANEGSLEIHDGVPYRKTYRDIRLENKELAFDERGQVIEKDVKGFTFFEMKPKYFTPSHRGFQIKFGAGSELPVSKPMLRSQAVELFDRLMMITEVTNYEPEKIADYLVDKYEIEPSDLKSDQANQEESVESNRVTMAIDLAVKENQTFIRGGQIPQMGTPFAPPAHTKIHIDFLRSPQLKSIDEQMYQMLVQHIYGEIQAQNQRGMGQQGAQPQQGAQDQSMMASTVGQGVTPAMPAMIQGGNQVPTGRVLNNG